MNYPRHILARTEKPARYTGGEANAVMKDKNAVSTRFCLCFPDVYEVGMSWSGLNILYYQINDRADAFCERAFAPWPDMEALLRENGLPLVTLETGDNLSEMDMLGFTLQYEMSYTNLLNMLDLSGIPLLAADRGEGCPIVCAGGPCSCNPEPLADFVDFFFIGEAEAGLDAVLDAYARVKARGGGKAGFLNEIAGLPGVYVPSMYDVAYNGVGAVASVTPNNPRARAVVTKASVRNLDHMFLPAKQIVPSLESIHDRVSLEVFRGCIRGCRFCQAGYVYRPQREKSPEVLLDCARSMIQSTGHDEISLLSLSTGDYSRFEALAEGALALGEDNVSLSLPSLRVDAFSLELMEKIAGARKAGLTFAPEAGTQRLRDVINKNLSEEEILEGCRLAFLGGWNRVKLYFMIGLPTETEEDIRGIAELSDKIAELYYSVPRKSPGKDVSVQISASCFVPKPHTPFQFSAQDSLETLSEKQKLLKRSIRKRQVKFSYHNADVSVMEGAISRGDRRVGTAILEAFRRGARFDGWSECFRFDVWKEAFDAAGLDIAFYAGRERGFDEVMPWDHIHMGVARGFLEREMKRAMDAETTPDCRTACAGCGADGLAPDAAPEERVCRRHG